MTQLIELLPGIFCMHVSDKSSGYEISMQDDNIPCLTYWYGDNLDPEVFCLEPGNWSIICCSSTATEEEAAKVVESFHRLAEPQAYKDYSDLVYRFFLATESLASLIRSRGLEDKLNWLILKLD